MTARTAVHLALVALLAATATLLAAGIRHRLTDDSVLTTLVTGAPGVAALLAAVVVRRWWPRRTELRTGVRLGVGAPLIDRCDGVGGQSVGPVEQVAAGDRAEMGRPDSAARSAMRGPGSPPRRDPSGRRTCSSAH
ncbi:hypothetical protein [Mycolicibacterium insubricum]|uniref:hypothetical protein n=1 Tax=Mycolicibacterium insubricum TaxID=444597 RepID=UPI002AE56465|nr:hypothetical protein [Mycolicibacterium insubricum]